jgi:hypothetical protein
MKAPRARSYHQGINRPQFWKDELLREDLRLTRRLEEDGAKHLVEKSMMLEKFAFVTAYMMRKLSATSFSPSSSSCLPVCDRNS